MLDNLKNRVRGLKLKTYALSIAYRDPRTPWYARLLAAAVVAYAFSPIDLIPDFIPVLGYLDDLIIIPLGVYLALKLIPAEAMADAETKAGALLQQGKAVSRIGAAIIVAIWLLLVALGIVLVGRAAGRG